MWGKKKSEQSEPFLSHKKGHPAGGGNKKKKADLDISLQGSVGRPRGRGLEQVTRGDPLE